MTEHWFYIWRILDCIQEPAETRKRGARERKRLISHVKSWDIGYCWLFVLPDWVSVEAFRHQVLQLLMFTVPILPGMQCFHYQILDLALFLRIGETVMHTKPFISEFRNSLDSLAPSIFHPAPNLYVG